MIQDPERRIKRHDTGPPVRAQIVSEETGRGVDLSAIMGAKFIMCDVDGNVLVNNAASPSVGVDGFIQYNWVIGDTEVVGNHQAEFEITFVDGRVESYPEDGYIEIHIQEDLDDAP